MENKFQWAIKIDNFDSTAEEQQDYINYSKKLCWISDVKITQMNEDGEQWEEQEAINGFEIDDMIRSIRAKNLDVSKIKSIFLDPGCTIPRFKMKSLCDKHKLSVRKYAKDADIIILGKKSFNKKFYDDYSEIMISKEDALEIVSKLRKIDVVSRLEADITACPCEWVLIESYHVERALIEAKKISQKRWDDKERRRHTTEFNGLEEELAKYFDFGNNYYYEDQLLEMINDGVVIDAEMKETIVSMLKSKDRGNGILAMEIMSNCNYEKSIVHLWLLLKDHYQEHIMNRKERGYVNFKSLMNWLGYKNNDEITLDSIIDSLVSKRLWTRANMNILLPIAQDEIQEENNTEHLKIQIVDVSDELKSKLQEEAVS